jgi:hypothetical protein
VWPTLRTRKLDVEIRAGAGAGSFDLILHWLFEELATDGEFNEISHESQWDACRGAHQLVLPKSETDIFKPRGFLVVETSWDVLSGFVSRLAIVTKSPQLFGAY